MEPEKTICEVNPSQIVNFKYYAWSVIAIVAIIALWYFTDITPTLLLLALPLLYIFWKWLEIKYTILKITTQRLIVTRGIFNKRTNETELYRVRDSSIEEPFLYRMFGVGNVVIYTIDEVEGVLRFDAYKKPHWLKDQVRNNSEICRQNKRWGNDSVLIQDHLI